MELKVMAVSVAEAGRLAGVSSRTMAALVARKEILSRKIGRRRVIPVSALERFLERDHATGNTRATRGQRR